MSFIPLQKAYREEDVLFCAMQIRSFSTTFSVLRYTPFYMTYLSVIADLFLKSSHFKLSYIMSRSFSGIFGVFI